MQQLSADECGYRDLSKHPVRMAIADSEFYDCADAYEAIVNSPIVVARVDKHISELLMYGCTRVGYDTPGGMK